VSTEDEEPETELLLTRCFIRAELPRGVSNPDVEHLIEAAIRKALDSAGIAPEVVRVAHVLSPVWPRRQGG